MCIIQVSFLVKDRKKTREKKEIGNDFLITKVTFCMLFNACMIEIDFQSKY